MKASRSSFLHSSLGAMLPRSLVSATNKLVEGKEIVTAAGAVGTEPAEAARAGARILAAGGIAMDAAAAAALASCVLQPETSDIGGYVLCAVILEARSGRIYSLDANSVAPAAAHERLYQVLPLEGHPG